MELPIDIKNKLDSLTENVSLSLLRNCFIKLSNSYMSENIKNVDVIIDKETALTYALTRMNATFGAVSFALNKAKKLLNFSSIKSVIDFGSGTGSSLLAIKEVIPSFESYICIERNIEMINISKSLVEDKRVSYINEDINNKDISIKSDLVVASYFLNELKDEDKVNVLEKIFNASNNYILIVEPGTPHSYKEMMKIRDYFIKRNLHLVLPCPHEEECKIKEDDWCAFQVRVNRSKTHRLLKDGLAPFEDEKFTYLLFSKTQDIKCQNCILRNPIETNGKIEFTICKANTEIEKVIVFKKEKDKFKAAKKLLIGDEL